MANGSYKAAYPLHDGPYETGQLKSYETDISPGFRNTIEFEIPITKLLFWYYTRTA